MPTASGKPQKGDRIRRQIRVFKNEGPVRYGTVVERSTGSYYTLYVRWDEERPGDRQRWAYGRPGVDMLVDAAYEVAQGWIKVIA